MLTEHQLIPNALMFLILHQEQAQPSQVLEQLRHIGWKWHRLAQTNRIPLARATEEWLGQEP